MDVAGDGDAGVGRPGARDDPPAGGERRLAGVGRVDGADGVGAAHGVVVEDGRAAHGQDQPAGRGVRQRQRIGPVRGFDRRPAGRERPERVPLRVLQRDRPVEPRRAPRQIVRSDRLRPVDRRHERRTALHLRQFADERVGAPVAETRDVDAREIEVQHAVFRQADVFGYVQRAAAGLDGQRGEAGKGRRGKAGFDRERAACPGNATGSHGRRVRQDDDLVGGMRQRDRFDARAAVQMERPVCSERRRRRREGIERIAPPDKGRVTDELVIDVRLGPVRVHERVDDPGRHEEQRLSIAEDAPSEALPDHRGGWVIPKAALRRQHPLRVPLEPSRVDLDGDAGQRPADSHHPVRPDPEPPEPGDRRRAPVAQEDERPAPGECRQMVVLKVARVRFKKGRTCGPWRRMLRRMNR